MDTIVPAVRHQIELLQKTLHLLQQEDFTRHSRFLSGATIGQHNRHIAELFQCLLAGYKSGVINYDARKRDSTMECDKFFALECLNQISEAIDLPDTDLMLCVDYEQPGSDLVQMRTTYRRELMYNLEHAIHHMALIRVALNEFDLPMADAEHFGVAYATVKFRETCAQ